MLPQNRMFGVITVQSVGELVEHLTEHTWTLCTGFSLQGLFFLNDRILLANPQHDGRRILRGLLVRLFSCTYFCRRKYR
jgi:hypothetical protein